MNAKNMLNRIKKKTNENKKYIFIIRYKKTQVLVCFLYNIKINIFHSYFYI